MTTARTFTRMNARLILPAALLFAGFHAAPAVASRLNSIERSAVNNLQTRGKDILFAAHPTVGYRGCKLFGFKRYADGDFGVAARLYWRDTGKWTTICFIFNQRGHATRLGVYDDSAKLIPAFTASKAFVGAAKAYLRQEINKRAKTAGLKAALHAALDRVTVEQLLLAYLNYRSHGMEGLAASVRRAL